MKKSGKVTGEVYNSKGAMMRHEKNESKSGIMKEYGAKRTPKKSNRKAKR
jgi:hypothetical protein